MLQPKIFFIVKWAPGLWTSSLWLHISSVHFVALHSCCITSSTMTYVMNVRPLEHLLFGSPLPHSLWAFPVAQNDSLNSHLFYFSKLKPVMKIFHDFPALWETLDLDTTAVEEETLKHCPWADRSNLTNISPHLFCRFLTCFPLVIDQNYSDFTALCILCKY